MEFWYLILYRRLCQLFSRDGILGGLEGSCHSSSSSSQDTTAGGWIFRGMGLVNDLHAPLLLALPCQRPVIHSVDPLFRGTLCICILLPLIIELIKFYLEEEINYDISLIKLLIKNDNKALFFYNLWLLCSCWRLLRPKNKAVKVTDLLIMSFSCDHEEFIYLNCLSFFSYFKES